MYSYSYLGESICTEERSSITALGWEPPWYVGETAHVAVIGHMRREQWKIP